MGSPLCLTVVVLIISSILILGCNLVLNLRNKETYQTHFLQVFKTSVFDFSC